MYLYPDNLNARATMWLWKLSDLAVAGILALLSVFAGAYAGIWFPAAAAGTFVFLTIQVEGTTIKDFIRHAMAFFLSGQQHFEWKEAADGQKRQTVN